MLRVTPEKGICAAVPLGPVIVSTVTGPIGWGFPVASEDGRRTPSPATAEFPGNAVCKAVIPAGVGVRLGRDWEGATPVKKRSQYVLPNKNSLSFMTGPPSVQPKRFSTKRGTTGVVQPEDALWPEAQNPKSGFFSPLVNEASMSP